MKDKLAKQRDIILIGLGGHALVVLDALKKAQRHVSAYCDVTPKNDFAGSLSYLGNEGGELASEALAWHDFLVTVGDNEQRRRITEALEERGFYAAEALIHPTACIGVEVILGRGTQVLGNASINPRAKIGRGTIINTGAIVEHECEVGNFVHLAPGAVLAGNVHIGNGVLIGANATVLPGIRVGAGAIVGAGAVVLQDVAPQTTVAGNPARLIVERN